MDADDLLSSLRAGNRQVIHELLHGFRPQLKRYAGGILGRKMARRADTSDLVQESLARAFNHAHQFRGSNGAEFFGWLKAIVRTEAVRLQRHHQTRKRNVNLDVTSRTGPSDERAGEPVRAMVDRERLRFVAIALETLPQAEREVVRRRSLNRESFEQIGREMNRSSSAVKALWSRAIRRLRQQLAVDSTSTSG